MKIIGFDLKKQKYILAGELVGTTFLKKVKPFHFMRVVGGYGISEDCFQDIVSKGCKKITIITEDTNEKWSASIKIWREHCKIADYGNGKQRFLGLKYMKNEKNTN